MGKQISVDGETIVFKGCHIHKLRINYKKEGNGFHFYAICADVYIFATFFRNQEAPSKYCDVGMSPLHSRGFEMLEQLAPNKGYSASVDNLYN